MDIKEVIKKERGAAQIISDLKKKSVSVELWSDMVKDYDPLEHRICTDKTGRKDKVRSDGQIDYASRITIGLEQLLSKRITAFTFAIPVKRSYSNIDGNTTRENIAKAIEAVYKHARIDAENSRRGLNYYASCEFATLWYVVEKENTLYGFPSKYKLKCKTYSPMDNVKLYPLLDEYGDMLAMSLEYSKKVGDSLITYFETFTADEHITWRSETGADYKEMREPVAIGKIPIVYCYRNKPIYFGLSKIREEIEYALSRNSDVVAYNSAPVMKVSGGLVGEEAKGETRRIVRVESGGDVQYVSWSQSTEALKFHVEEMFKLYWTQSQMPDISADTMSKLGNIGFDARQTIFSDAHLKIGEESGALVEALERECNIIKAFLSMMNTQFASEIDNVDVAHIITPFIQRNTADDVRLIMSANGGKPVLSQKSSIGMTGLTQDATSMYDEIVEEQKADAESRSQVFESAF